MGIYGGEARGYLGGKPQLSAQLIDHKPNLSVVNDVLHRILVLRRHFDDLNKSIVLQIYLAYKKFSRAMELVTGEITMEHQFDVTDKALANRSVHALLLASGVLDGSRTVTNLARSLRCDAGTEAVVDPEAGTPILHTRSTSRE